MAENTGVRDKLAKDRTDLANERTLLAYIRTSLAFFLAGGFILKFETATGMIILAVVLLVIGIGIGAFGAQRFIQYRKLITQHEK